MRVTTNRGNAIQYKNKDREKRERQEQERGMRGVVVVVRKGGQGKKGQSLQSTRVAAQDQPDDDASHTRAHPHTAATQAMTTESGAAAAHGCSRLKL